MRLPRVRFFWPIVAVFSVTNVALGVWLPFVPSLVGGGLGLVFIDLAWRRRRAAGSNSATVSGEKKNAALAIEGEPADEPVDDAENLVFQMMRQGRESLLLRPQIIDNLSSGERHAAVTRLQDKLSLTPVGEVVLGDIDDLLEEGRLDEDQIADSSARIVGVEAFFLDRFLVTNHQYRQFVAAGGYEQMAIWDREIWAGVIDFVDQTGQPGPRFWHGGTYTKGEGEHPVVGVCWYEAAAYARWVGKRLPTDAEWVRAGSWPVVLSPAARLQRKYPWGSDVESERANIWGHGPNHTAPVDAYPLGSSVGGVNQMIGNVWEWMADAFRPDSDPASGIKLSKPMRSIRGGAFDTYFENQATCQFQSGETPTSRCRNVGFRCALGICDLAPEALAELCRSDDDDSTVQAEKSQGDFAAVK